MIGEKTQAIYRGNIQPWFNENEFTAKELFEKAAG